ncbi:transporter [Enterobacter cloacae]|nr:transporter [Enterobacter cloacae]
MLALIVGILVLDLTVQGVHITNQTVIYRVKPDARNRLTAGYMTSYFIGGAAGSLISASAWVARLSPSGSNSLSFTLLWAPWGVKGACIC